VRQSHALSKDCRQVGTSSVRVSRIANKAVSKVACELGVLHEQLANMPVRACMRLRASLCKFVCVHVCV